MCVSWVSVLCSQIPCRVLCAVRRKSLPFIPRNMYIGIPLYALSFCHPVNPSVAIECVRRTCEYFNVLSIYRAEHVFHEYRRDTDHLHHFDISLIDVTLNLSPGTNLPECQQITWIARLPFAHGTNLCVELQDQIIFLLQNLEFSS